MKSKIIIKGMHFKAYHGYYAEEQKIGGQYIIDLEMEVNIQEAAEEDKLESTVNYESIFELCREEMKINRKLIETVGLSILKRIQSRFPQVVHTVVEIHKINPPIDGLIDRASIRLEV